MRDDKGRLLHRYREGDAAVVANADDHAFMAMGLFDLYEATHDARYLSESERLTSEMLARFWDKEKGGFFFTPDDGETLLVRKKEIYDGATPSANSVALLNLLRLGGATARPEYEEHAAALSSAFSGDVGRYPVAYTMLLSAFEHGLGPSIEVAIVGDPDAPDTAELMRAVRGRFLPNRVLLLLPQEAPDDILAIAPWLEHYTRVDGRATAYVCRDHVCNFPVTDADALGREVSRAAPE
jgi:uncharacterized protein YyaL (SSP411 family)